MSGDSHVNEPVPQRCACRGWELKDGGSTYEGVRQKGMTSCRLCGLCMKVLEAIVDGELPALFQGARHEVERAKILKELVFVPDWSGDESTATVRVLFFMSTELEVYISRESDENPAFTVEGVEFPFPSRIIWGEEQDYVVPPVPRPSSRHYSDRSLERAKTWLHQCLDRHTCGKSDFYPKRLLDLRENRIRLFKTEKAKRSPGDFGEVSYVCLSHRWGSPAHKRLTSTVVNIANHMDEIAWKDIPKTFQDAITVCRRMSVSYLWIDTVCILQEYDGMSVMDREETEADFAAENSAMARIYQNSLFTICASMSTNMDSGIFPTQYDHRMKVTGDDGAEAVLRVMAVHSHDTPPTDLETRGWTYQEYLLPPRVLEFGPFDVSWRCKKDYLCECKDIGFVDHFARGWRKTIGKQAQPPRNVENEAGQWWVKTVRHYTGRSLTKHQDKLPALSGIAQIYHEVTQDTYLAGLWKASLPHSLCWYHCSGDYYEENCRIGVGRRAPSRAPSWSWASIDAIHNAQCRTWWPGVVYHGISLIHYDPKEAADVRGVCTIYGADVQAKTDDPFGEVFPGGCLQLGVTLISAKIDTEAQDDEWLSDMCLFSDSAAWTLNNFKEDDTHIRFCLPDCGLDDDGLKLGDEVLCAPIVERLSEKSSERGCLILKQRQDQEYQRVGFCILVKENPNYHRWGHRWGNKEQWEPNAPGNTNYALQWSLDTQTRIKIL